MRIGVFDSGIGGLNVLKVLMKRYPNNHYIYHGDTLNVPYGDKSKEEIKRLLINTLDFFKEKECTFVIVACGTMSSLVDQELIDNYRPYFNLIDILTPTINFLNKCIYKRIGIIGTTRTIEENKFSSVNKELVLKATPSFVPMIEDGSYKRKKDKIEAELEYFKDKVDCIVLGCTHYPLIHDTIDKYLHKPVLDMGILLCNSINLNSTSISDRDVEIYFTKLDDKILEHCNKLIYGRKEIKEIK